MADQTYSNDDEIDLSELFSTLWAHKIWIGMLTGLSIFLSGYYALTSEKLYSAKAIFEIEKSDSGGLNLSGEIGALASLAGFSGGSSSGSEILLERVMGREFILAASQKLNLKNDSFFQTFTPNSREPLWKSTIKKLIGWQKSTQDERLIIEQTIQGNYLEFVTASLTNAGAIEISVTHNSPERASQYANTLMDLTREVIEQEENKVKDIRLSYLAETLADALQDMENAQNNLKNYALENSTAAQENFISGSLKLDNLRVERQEAVEIIVTLNKLEDLVEMGGLDRSAYEALRVDNPLVDDANFRRILGMSETISAWSWPDLETISNVSSTLKDRINRLDVEIAEIEEDAKKFASSAEDLAKLTREMKIAEATFTVLTEQVKSQSLAAGFKPDTFKVFAYASPPLNPSSPKRNLILTLGAVIGFFLGCALSIIYGVQRNVFYTYASLISMADATVALPSKPLRRFGRIAFPKLVQALEKRRPEGLDEATITLSHKKIIYVINAGGTLPAKQIAHLLATQSHQSGRSVLVFDAVPSLNKNLGTFTLREVEGLSIEKPENGYDVIRGFDGFSFFTSSIFERQLQALVSAYDQILISSDNHKTNAGLIALEPFELGTVVLTRLRKTKKDTINKIKSIHPITVLFHA